MLRTLRAGSAASGAKASSFNLGSAIAASLTYDSPLPKFQAYWLQG